MSDFDFYDEDESMLANDWDDAEPQLDCTSSTTMPNHGRRATLNSAKDTLHECRSRDVLAASRKCICSLNCMENVTDYALQGSID